MGIDMKRPTQFDVLGVGISDVNLTLTVRIAQEWIKTGDPKYICFCNVHTVMSCQHDPMFYKVIESAGLAVPDGMPLVWIGRLKGGKQISRVYGPDFMLALCQLSQDLGYRHYFYGGEPDVAEDLKDKLQKRYPRLKVVGTYSPPFRPLTQEEDAEVVEKINMAKPQYVWVSLGGPKQDYWAFHHVGRIEGAVILPVGAAFDFLTGRVPQAPRWMQQAGLEWLFRLLSEPRRLWRRYLIENPKFLLMVLGQALGLWKSTKE